jgi:pyruvate/2-oxoglutarate dehydrogenase complex dihydrolipoamide dehydrogenase (E3) component
MTDRIDTDLCVIGAGSGGLAVAAGAVQMGARVALIEKGKMGGDCLNYGCVPSKALIAAAKAAHTVRSAARFGVNGHEPEIDFLGVHDHVKGVIAAIAPHDSQDRFEGLGVEVIRAHARFTGPREVEADGRRIRARRFVIATGSSPAVPPIPGLDDVPHLTNETVFDLTEGPEHLFVIGGGPIGCELAQAHRRLGAKVTLLEMFSILPKDDSAAVAVVRDRLLADGVDLREHVQVSGITRDGNGVAVTFKEADSAQRVAGSHLLVAAGRRANVDGLGLGAAGIAFTPGGITVDDRLRTTNRRVFAIGDVAGGFQFTHMAAYHAGIVIRNALFKLPAKVDHRAVPWVTYTDPELAQVGVNEPQAKDQGLDLTALTWTFARTIGRRPSARPPV